MPSSAFTFRCPHCKKLLGASRSSIGSAVDCPRCKAELAVPSPEEPTPSPSFLTRSQQEKKPGSAPPPAFEPFLPDLNIEDDPYSLRGDSASRSQRVGSAPNSRTDTKTPDPEPSSFSGEVAASTEPYSASTTSQVVPLGAPLARRNDILLPRTALVLWSFITLAALIFAFAAGFLAGRHL